MSSKKWFVLSGGVLLSFSVLAMSQEQQEGMKEGEKQEAPKKEAVKKEAPKTHKKGHRKEASESAQEKQQAQPPFLGKIRGQKVNVRLKASSEPSSRIITILNVDDKVGVVKEEGDFYEVLPPKGAWAYVTSNAVKVGEEKDSGVITVEEASARSDSRLDAEIVGSFKEGDKVKVLREVQGWYKVEAPSNARFYVSRKYVKVVASAKDEGELVQLLTGEKAVVEGEKPPKGGGDEAMVRKLQEAERLIAEENAKLGQNKVLEMDYSTAIAVLEDVATNARDESLKKDAKRMLEYLKTQQAVIKQVTQKIISIEKAVDDLRKNAGMKAMTREFAYQGTIDSVGPFLVGKPRGCDFKLLNGDKIVCFLRHKDAEGRAQLSQWRGGKDFVGVNGMSEAISSGPFTGLKVVSVEQIEVLHSEQ